MANPTCNWSGMSGAVYKYFIHPFGDEFGDQRPANYIFTKCVAGRHSPLYVGETDNAERRCCGTHEKWAAAIRLGATHIHIHVSSLDKGIRCAEETDIRRKFRPPLNDQ